MSSFQTLWFWNAGLPNTGGWCETSQSVLSPLGVQLYLRDRRKSDQQETSADRLVKSHEAVAQPWGKHWTLAGQAYVKPSSSLSSPLASVPSAPPRYCLYNMAFHLPSAEISVQTSGISNCSYSHLLSFLASANTVSSKLYSAQALPRASFALRWPWLCSLPQCCLLSHLQHKSLPLLCSQGPPVHPVH